MKQKVTVHKLDPNGEEVWSYEGVELERSPTQIILEAFFDREDQSFHGLTLRHGDRFEEIYYSDRWYSIYRIYDVHSKGFKGWYCNFSRPARLEPDHIYSEDLALDLLVFPEGQWIVLDQTEFDDLDLLESDRKEVQAALEELKELIHTRSGFFGT
jgi:hypothetical protein